MTKPMMLCGHAANATIAATGRPVCAICAATSPAMSYAAATVDPDPPPLDGRMAQCGSCKRTTRSSPDLAFFGAQPDRPFDSFYDGCRGWD